MGYEVAVRTVPACHVAVVRERRRWQDLGAKLIPLLDRVYVAARSGRVAQTGHNIFIFRDGSKDGVTVEVGVEVAGPFQTVDGIVSVTTPAGEAASTVHVGDYSDLGKAHQALAEWCMSQRRARPRVYWEVYGDWREDPSELQTEVFYSLAHP